MKKLSLLIGCFAWALSGFAGHSNDNYFINGSTVAPNAAYTVSTSEFANYPNPPASLFTDVEIEDMITLMIDHSSTVYQATKLDYTFNIQVFSWDAALNIDSTTIQLRVEYDPAALTSFRDKHVHRFEDKVKVFTRIISIFDNTAQTWVTNPADIFMLRTDINVERYYPLNYSNPVAGVQAVNFGAGVYLNDEGEYVITWSNTTGAEEYDLEWTWVNTYTSTYGTQSVSGIEYDFRFNSTRVRLTGNQYKISNVFDKGTLVFRVRAVGRNPNNFDKLLFGPWNIAGYGLVSGLSTATNYVVTAGHEYTMNWQYSATFAEEGKKKEVVSYFDGSLRSRQMVTRSNSTYDVLVAESFYDHQGRKALEALPVPVDRNPNLTNGGNKIEYYENFNKAQTSLVKYSRDNFDIDEGAGQCLALADPFSTTSGAARYYSSSNPDQTGFNGYLPEADGFPFIRTEFTPDNTGRIRRQGGVGPDHQLGSNHESKYFYGKPLQLELDRLFGSEAGYARFYKKDMVIDPNGQVSVSYKDLTGKVVATALSGGNPTMVNSLNSQVPAAAVTADLFEKDFSGNSQMNRLNQEGDALVFNTTLLVAEAATFAFTYTVTAPAYIDGCMNQNICFDCVYDLTIRIVDDCGVEVGSRTASVGLAQLDLTCANPQISYSSNNPTAFNIPLSVGNYHVYKELKINEEAFNYYMAALMDSTKGCFKTEAMFIAEEIANVDSSGCELTCEECVAALGTRDAFVLSGLGQEEDWQLAYDNCVAPCLDASKCENLYRQMLADMSPGGQYGEWYDTSTARMNSGAFPLSILNMNNRLPTIGTVPNVISANWRNPTHPTYGTGYYYPNGKRASIMLAKQEDGSYLPEAFTTFTGSDGFQYAYPENLSNNKDFVFYWHNNWAKSLVIYHPEYCYYEWCEVNDEKTFNEASSEDFDNEVTATETFNQAVTLNLVSGSSPSHLLLLDKDPYFASGGRGSAQYTEMNTILGGTNYQGTGYNIFEMAAFSARCPGYFGSTNPPPTSWNCFDFGQGSDPAILDQEWGMVKGIYQAEKFKLQQKSARAFVSGSNCAKGPNGCIGEKDYIPGMDGFSSWDAFNSARVSSPDRYYLYATKTRRFQLERDLVVSDNQVGFDLYYNSGKCPEAFYLESFLQALTREGDLLNTFSLRNKPYFLEQIYSKVNGGIGSSYVDYTYTPSIVANTYVDVLRIQFFDNVPLPSPCEINIILPNIYDWSMVNALRNLSPFPNNGDPKQFKITAFLDEDTDPSTPDIEVDLIGTSCFEVSGCEFELACEPSQFALDLLNLMNHLVEATGNDLLSTSAVSLQTPDYSDYLTSNIIIYMSPITSNRAWRYNSTTHKFYLESTAIGQNTYIEFDFLAYDPGTFTDLDLSKIEYFARIKPDPNNGFRFYLVAYYDDGNPSTPLEPLTIHVQAGFSSGLFLEGGMFGSCHVPVPSHCQTPPHLTRNDLEPFLNGIVTNPPSSTTDLNDMPLWTDYLQGQLGVGSYKIGEPEVYFDSIVFDIISDEFANPAFESICKLKIFRIRPYYDGRYDFANIVQLKNIRVNTGKLIDGKAYAFVLTAVHSNGVEEEIGGSTSCLPINDCACAAASFGGGGEGSLGILDCDALYAAYLESIHRFNENKDGNNPTSIWLEPIARENFDCGCMESYALYLRTSPAPDPWLSYEEFCAQPDGCGDQFQDYVDAVNDFNIGHPGQEVSLDQVDGELCVCFANYIKYLKNFTGSSIPLSIIEFSGTMDIDDPNYCDDIYLDGEGCIEKIENLKRAHLDFMNDPARNPYGYQWFGLTGPELDPNNCDCLDAYAQYLDNYPTSPTNLPPQSFTDFDNGGGCGGGSMMMQQGTAVTKDQGTVKGHDGKKKEKVFGDQMMMLTNPEDIILENSSIYSPVYAPGWSCGNTIQFNSQRFGYYSRCGEHLIEVAVNNGKIRYKRYLDSLQGAFRNNYNQHCLGALQESFSSTFNERTYHYTLYYYDQAGNLVRTVPPAGVVQLSTQAQMDSVNYDRTFKKRKFFTQHTLVTKYEYNSLNQLVKQSVPDHDMMDRWYINESPLLGALPANFTATASYAVNTSSTVIAGLLNGEAVLYRSDDAGKNWYAFGNILASDLNELVMVNTNDGYAIGKDGLLYKTGDGGNSWSIQPHTLGIGEHLNDLYFKDASNGVVVGENGTCYYTSNGGSSWTATSTSLSGSITGITAQSTSNLFITVNLNGQSTVYKSTNFGVNWTAATQYQANDIADVHMLSASEGFAAGKSGTLMHTTDGGANWFLVPTGTALDFRTIYFRDATKGFAILEESGDGGHIYKTADGGETWVQASIIGKYRSFSFYSTDEGYATGIKGADGILAHLNANTGVVAKQAKQTAFEGINLYAVHFNTVDEGYVSGDGGKFLLSTNASSPLAVWTDVSTGYTGEDFRDMYFRTANEGVILSEAGKIVVKNMAAFSMPFNGASQYYTDLEQNSGYLFVSDKNSFGKVWRTPTNTSLFSLAAYTSYTSTENPNSDALRTVATISGTSGIVAGDAGILLNNTTVQTKKVKTLPLQAINAVYGGSSVFAAGEEGDFWVSTDNGTSWKLQTTATANAFYGLDFNSATAGLIGGENGTLLKYTSGTLSAIGLTTTNTILDIDYLNANDVALSGTYGLIQKSTDGGTSWTNAGYTGLSYPVDINGVAYIASGNIAAVGDLGLVWKSTGTVLTRITNLRLPEITDIHFVNENLGIMSGDKGTLLRSDNGGGTWLVVPAPNKNKDRLNSAWRVSSSEWFVGHQNGAIKRSITTGSTWTTAYTAAQPVNDLAFDGENAAVAVGDNGLVLYSANAGSTWQASTLGTPTSVKLRSVQMVNQRGYLAGDNGTFMSSDNWGQNWTTYATGTTENLHDVFFYDYYTGYVIGENGTLRKSIEGGDNWTAKTNNINGLANTTQDLYTMAFNHRFNGIFAGDNYQRRLEDEADLFSGFFYYDRLGRLTISENTKQFNKPNYVYSYTLFDYKGRITEVGEMNQNADVRTLVKDRQIVDADLLNWINGANSRLEVTSTVYDIPLAGLSIPGFTQENLRKRVASVFYEEVYDGSSSTYTNALHYTYDIHGNVKAMIQDNPVLSAFGREYIRMDYTYDLVSGNVKAFAYQDGLRDQWHHRYDYDADNRITEVQTSLDGIIWDVDARYDYYRHGPLARTETGDIQVQGSDFAYTLQGWLKGVNSMTLAANEDMGLDGATAPGFAKDAYGFILGYHGNDYTAINTMNPGPGHFVPNTTGSDLLAHRSDFFNGNISMMVTAIKDPTNGTILPQGYAYHYDQLNRLAQMRAFSNYNLVNNEFLNGGGTPVPYGENFSYDANGNILTLSRSGVAANPNMDNLSYKYDYYNNNPAEGLRSNRLYHVNDAISSTGYDDIQDQGSFVPENQSTSIKEVNTQNNYGYDELGNLIRDNQEEIATITWSVSGKIKTVTRTGGSTLPNLEFVYDPMGHRIAKIETPNPYVATEVKTTFYGRDAQGNHLVTYDHHWNPNTSNEHLLLDERIMYGSKRLGLQDFNDSIWGPEDVPPVLDYYERNLGRKKYEGTNHLGNVLAVYSDKKLPKDDITPGGPIDYYEADIHGAYDYYSFGSPMPDRTFVPEACSTQTLVINNYTYQDNFPNPVPLWNPVGGAAIGWAGPGAMTVNCNIPNEGVQQALPCMPGVQNTLDLTLTFGNNDIQIMLLDPLTMLPLPGYPILYPAQPFGTVLNIQLFFIGPPAGNVIVQITSPGGPFPYPDMFMVNYAAISTQTTLQQQVCWDEDYRFGFNGMEKDNEAKGLGNHYDLGLRNYDSRLGRMFSIDPRFIEYPWQTTYAYHRNCPVTEIDYLGGGDEEAESADEDPKNDVAAIGGTLTLPANAEVTSRNAKGDPHDVVEGSVKSFKIGQDEYTATFDSEGAFGGYKTASGTLYTGKEVFDNLAWYYWDDNYSPSSDVSWPINSGDVKDGVTPYVHDEATTRLVQATLGVGVTRLKQLFGIGGKASDAVSAGLTLAGATQFKVSKRSIYQYTTSRNWYGRVAFNPVTGTTYCVPTGTSSARQVRVGVASTQYQINFQNVPVEGATWTDEIKELRTPTTPQPPPTAP